MKRLSCISPGIQPTEEACMQTGRSDPAEEHLVQAFELALTMIRFPRGDLKRPVDLFEQQ